MDKVNLHGIYINNVTMNETLNEITRFISEEEPKSIYTPNSEILMQAQRNPELRQVLNNASLLIADGAGVVLASKILKTPLKEKVSGIDVVTNLFKIASGKNISFFILGGEPGTAELAAVNIMSSYGKVKINGYHHGYFKEDEEDKLIKKINESKSDILLVGFGAPKQELWINKNISRIKCKVFIGIGGSIDIFAGKAVKAPEFMRKSGFEWLFRLIREPKRFKRMLDLPRFMILTLKKRLLLR